MRGLRFWRRGDQVANAPGNPMRASRETTDQRETKDGARRSADVGAWSLLVAGCLLIALAYVVGYGWHPEQLRSFLKDFLFAVATAVLVTWGLTRLMEIPHVADYVAGKLADIMFGEKYLTSIRSSLPDIRKRIDRVVYGEAALGYPWSLYNFVNEKVHEFYKASFRRNFTVEIECRRDDNDPRLMRWREKTSYIYIRNREDKKVPAVRLFHKAYFGPILRKTDATDERRKLFNEMVTRLEVRVGDVILRGGDDRTSLTRVGGSERKQEELKWEVDDSTLLLDFDYKIPPEVLARDEVTIEILEEHLEPLRDDVYYLGMVEPTEDFNLVCNFPEDVRLELLRFTMTDPETESPVGESADRGHGMISINGWLLPGHGGCVAWYGMAATRKD
jgi:hypothetical protein